jgi:hypothetical protein
MKTVMQIASVPKEEWTEKEKERFETFDNEINELLAKIEVLLGEQNEE